MNVTILSNFEKLNKIIAQLHINYQELLIHTQRLMAKEKKEDKGEKIMRKKKERKEKIAQITQFYNIFVYCGCKCGSMTLHKTFNENNYKSFHIHNNQYYKHVYNTSFDMFDLINASAKKYETIYLIDVYRTPIERKISRFFHNILDFLPHYTTMTLQELMDYFDKTFLYSIEEFHPINEVLSHYDMPLFTTFDFDKRYNLVKNNNKIFIKLLFKDIGEWTTILSDLFQKPITIYSDNLTENKPVKFLYKDFLKDYKVPNAYLEHMKVNDTEFKIYNTKKEQKAYLKNWKKKSYN
jgi:hypothetical protein